MDQSSLLGGREVMTRLGRSFGWRLCQIAFFAVTGCSMYEGAARNTLVENLSRANTNDIAIRDPIAAKQAWDTIIACEPEQTYSKDYEKGFIAGFVNYVEEDGTTAPPGMPPYRYWGVKYQDSLRRPEVD